MAPDFGGVALFVVLLRRRLLPPSLSHPAVAHLCSSSCRIGRSPLSVPAALAASAAAASPALVKEGLQDISRVPPHHPHMDDLAPTRTWIALVVLIWVNMIVRCFFQYANKSGACVLTFASNANEAITDHCTPGACVFANTIDHLFRIITVMFCRMDTLNQHVECADISTQALVYLFSAGILN